MRRAAELLVVLCLLAFVVMVYGCGSSGGPTGPSEGPTGKPSGASYRVIDLGAACESAYPYSYPKAINENGQITGTCEAGSGATPCIWTWNGSTVSFELLGSTGGLVQDISDSGMVVGERDYTPVVWQKSANKWKETILPVGDGADGSAKGVNSASPASIVGWEGQWNDDDPPVSTQQAVVWTQQDGSWLRTYLPGGPAVAYDVNDSGIIVGGSRPDTPEAGLLWQPGQGVRSLGSGTFMCCIAKRGNQAAGYTSGKACWWPALDGPPTAFPIPKGWPEAIVGGLNSKGQVVGYARKIDRKNSCYSLTACLWQNGALQTLDGLITGSGWTALTADDVDERGWIAARGKRTGVDSHALLLLPTN